MLHCYSKSVYATYHGKGSEAIAPSSEDFFNQQLHTFSSHTKFHSCWYEKEKKVLQL